MKCKTLWARTGLALLAVLFSLTGARAQQALPYSYGFENNDLAAEGWTVVDGAESTGIRNTAQQSGDYGFQFMYNQNPPQYLISPELTGTESGVSVSFSYKNPSSYNETFKVGYSTTTNDKDAFEWDEEITPEKKGDWAVYENNFPAGTKYVAVAYTANDQFKIYIDDFSFTIPDGFSKPANFAVTDITSNSAVLSWTEKGSATKWVILYYPSEDDEDVTQIETEENPYKLTGLTPETTYEAYVRPYGDNNKWSVKLTFTTTELYPRPTALASSEIESKTAVLSWTENGTATTWEICLNDDEENIVTADSNPFTLTGLTPDTKYTAKVRAVYGIEEKSKWSSAISFTTDVAFPVPTSLAVTPKANTAEVTWTGKADSYTLRYRSYKEGAVLFSDDFESGMDQWTIYTEGAAPKENGWYEFNPSSSLSFGAYSGSNVASSWSWSSSAYDANNWLVTPQVTFGTTLKFWVRTNAGYPDSYEVLLSTTGNATTDFTETLQAMAPAPAEAAWNEVVIDLSAYAGQEGYIAIHHVDNDMNYLLIDDFAIMGNPITGEWVTVNDATSPYTIESLTAETIYEVEVQAVYSDGKSEWAATSFTTLEDVPTPSALAVSDVTWGTAVLSWTENGTATAWEVCLDGDETNPIAADSNPFTVTGLTPETEYTAKVRAVNGEKRSNWSNEVAFTTEIRFHAPTDLAVNNITTTSAEISWNAAAAATGAVLEYADATGASLTFTEYKYDNGTFKSSVGLGGGAFLWGVMFPAGSYTGTTLSKVSVYDAMAMTGSVTIYNDGDAAPENPVATVPVTFTGIGDFIDIAIDATIDDTKNVWVIFNNESGATYPAATSNDDLGDANGRWVEINGAWYDLADAGISGQCFMVRAEIGTADLSALTWTTVADATSPYELTGLTPETTYAVRVKSVFAEGESKWTSAIFTTESENPVPANIALDLAADGATFTWEGLGDSYNVRYRTAESAGETIFEDNFDNGLDKWTTVTAGEGPGWVIGTETGGNAATAYSWNGGVSYNADNWLISPAVELGGVLTFTVTTANSYPDSYEVLLSTTGTELEDFTITLQAMAAATNGTVTIDLSNYAGQTGYIAFHHVSYDCYLLVIDDFGVYAPNVPAGEWQDMAVTEKTATISGLATNNLYEYQVQSVKGGSTSEWSKLADFALLTLDSNADNNSVINTYNGKFAHVTLADRTFFKDNTWNTIYLPFDMTLDEVAASPLADADVRTMTNNITVEDKTVTLNFTAEGEALTTWSGNMFYGGLPYIAKWTQGSNIVNPEFANVTITNARYYVGDNTKVAFVGTYAPISYDAEDKSILFIGEGNKLFWPETGAKIGAFRGYFQLYGITAEYNESGAKQFVTNLDGEDPTSIANISNVKDNNEWYDLSGRKLAGKPNTKGIFVTGGRKVTIK